MNSALAQDLIIVNHKTNPQKSLVNRSDKLKKKASEDNHPTYIPQEKT